MKILFVVSALLLQSLVQCQYPQWYYIVPQDYPSNGDDPVVFPRLVTEDLADDVVFVSQQQLIDAVSNDTEILEDEFLSNLNVTDDEKSVTSITGPVSQVISPSIPLSSNTGIYAANTATSHVPFVQQSIPPAKPILPQYPPLGSSYAPLNPSGSQWGAVQNPVGSYGSGGLWSQPQLQYPLIQGLLGTLLNRPHGHHHHHISPPSIVIPGYSITVGGGGINLPGYTRH